MCYKFIEFSKNQIKIIKTESNLNLSEKIFNKIFRFIKCFKTFFFGNLYNSVRIEIKNIAFFLNKKKNKLLKIYWRHFRK